MKEKMLVLPMKKKWFDMILSGDKKEEYREFKPYWETRVRNWEIANGQKMSSSPILFINGYGTKAPRFIGWCSGYSIRSTFLHPEWGEKAYERKPHFVFSIKTVQLL